MIKRIGIAFKNISLMAFILVASGCSDMMSDLADVPPPGLDIFILMDLTGGCLTELVDLRANFTAPTGNYQLGLASFQDFPIAPYGQPSDLPFTLQLALSDDKGETENAVLSLTIINGSGNDDPEAQLEALYQLATGEGYAPYVAPCNPGWDGNSRKYVILITDSLFHTEVGYPGHTYSQTLAALAQKNISVMGVDIYSSQTFQDIINDTHGQIYAPWMYGSSIGLTVNAIIDDLLNP